IAAVKAQCPGCQARAVAPAKAPAKLRCPKCAARFTLYEDGRTELRDGSDSLPPGALMAVATPIPEPQGPFFATRPNLTTTPPNGVPAGKIAAVAQPATPVREPAPAVPVPVRAIHRRRSPAGVLVALGMGSLLVLGGILLVYWLLNRGEETPAPAGPGPVAGRDAAGMPKHEEKIVKAAPVPIKPPPEARLP